MTIAQRSLRLLLAVCAALGASAAAAAPTETIRAGLTRVDLAPSFLQALTALKVDAAALAPARLRAKRDIARAIFPITTGGADLAGPKVEISHEGGLSLSGTGVRVELSSFVIDVTGSSPRLTGLVVANDNLIGRIPLFDLSLAASTISARDGLLSIRDVDVTLTAEAATALNGVFSTGAFVEGIAIGSANVRAVVDNEH